MFESLTDKLQQAFKTLSGYGRISENNIGDALREVRMALLDADVNFQVVKDFIERVKEKSLGAEVIKSVSPGQQIIKIIHDELVGLLGSENAELNTNYNPTKIMMVGLHGSGKTTSTGKLAKLLQKQGKTPLLVACDVYRPAAIDQLKTLGAQLNIPVYTKLGEMNVPKIAEEAIGFAILKQCNVLIFDTAGRLQIDEPLVEELKNLKSKVKPQEIILVADSSLGQQAVDVAKGFNDALDLTGVILTKLDGDARGGAAISIRSVTGKPIKFVGTGEKMDALEPFHPDRMASRILGMGDIVTLVEKAQEHIDTDKAEELERKMRKGDMDMNDFLEQLRQVKNMGNLENLLGMLPGVGNVLSSQSGGGLIAQGEKQMKRSEAMIQSMTPGERRFPHLINVSRRQRIARGSGASLVEVNQFLKQFEEMKKMMKNMGKMQKLMTKMGGGLPMQMPGMPR
ncbi:MAG: signal recognition particle protein [Verrucomicrobiota bacterium]|nr:signal recognition particle protein [Verrucomicrobiota bacterium]